MYQVLVVDDEIEIRQGLARWDWGNLPVQVAGCCAHGLEALRFLADTPVDILLTDIRMPFLDGLELMDAVGRRHPFVRTIVLSGYSEFEYARQAMRLGAEDYLLKPIDPADLHATVERLVQHMDSQKQMEARMAQLQRQSNLLSLELRREFLDTLLRGPLTPEELEYGGMAGEVMLEGDAFAAAIVRQDDASAADTAELNFSLDCILQRYWDVQGLGYHLMRRDGPGAVLVGKGGQRERFEPLFQTLVKYRSLFRSTFSLIVGPQVGSPAQLHRSFAAAGVLAANTPRHTLALCPDLAPAESAPKVPVVAAAPLDTRLLTKAKQFMQTHYGRSITLKDVADHVYVSPGYLSALFKANNETFLKVLTKLRVDQAMALLRDPGLKIYEIVGMVGYSDNAYFTEVFKRQTGKTPTDYRAGALSAPR